MVLYRPANARQLGELVAAGTNETGRKTCAFAALPSDEVIRYVMVWAEAAECLVENVASAWPARDKAGRRVEPAPAMLETETAYLLVLAPWNERRSHQQPSAAIRDDAWDAREHGWLVSTTCPARH